MTTIAHRIALAIKKADPERTHSVEVMRYSLTILLNTSLIVLISLLIGWMAGELQATLATLLSFMFLRMASGGFHIRSSWGCNLVSTMVCAGIPLVPSLSSGALLAMNLISMLIMAVLAPQPDRNTRMPKRFYPYLKLLSLLLVSSNFLIDSQVIGLAFFVQSLTIIPWRKEVRI